MNEENQKEQVVVTVLGLNKPGILAGITRAIADSNVSIEDVSQKIMQGYFALMMITDLSTANCNFEEFQNRMQEAADKLEVKTFIQHEEVFKVQHRL
ncbi:MAG: ACT domain-containing protein [Candidatus Riflebacteria bacterium]|nr:ACT domain-containing protein [Candidatus Riflebacteria bacterium]